MLTNPIGCINEIIANIIDNFTKNNIVSAINPPVLFIALSPGNINNNVSINDTIAVTIIIQTNIDTNAIALMIYIVILYAMPPTKVLPACSLSTTTFSSI